MARQLTELQQQYNSASHGESLRGGFGGGPRHGRHVKGKPKNLGKTVKRILTLLFLTQLLSR